MKKLQGFFSLFIPCVTVFISSLCIMALELVASRLIAHRLGSSLYTWTAVIGIVLAGITIGNYVGGRIADRFQAKKALSILFILSSAACVVVVILNNITSEWIWIRYLSWPVRVFTHVAFVFLLPSVLLGTISPVIAKMALDRGLATGRTVGDIYAWGAAGSIAGTFLAGFYLIAAIGTISIVWTIGAAMQLMAILYRPRFWPVYLWAAFFAAALAMGMIPGQWAGNIASSLALRQQPDPTIVYEDETQYCYIMVKQMSKKPDMRFFIQDKLKHSIILMDDITNLQYFYTKIYASLTHGLSKGKEKLSVLAIGGGGYVYPRYIEKHWPGSRIDVAEIDPAVTEAAIQAFGLERDTAINIFTMDARNYIDQLLEKERNGVKIPRYDFIYEDAFSDYSVPYQLVTKQFHDKISKILADNGVYMINLIDTYESGQFLGAIINTLKKTFPFVYVVAGSVTLPFIRNTFVVAAAKIQFDPEAILSQYDKNLEVRCLKEPEIKYLKRQSDGMVLTDDYAPVENLLAPVVRKSGDEIWAHKCLEQAEQLKKDKHFLKAIARFEKAVELNPSMAIKAYNEIGLINVEQGNLEKGAEAFQKAIEYHHNLLSSQNIIGSIHFNLAITFQKMQRPQQAKEHFEKAVERFRIEIAENPDDTLLWTRLGDTLAEMGDFEAASEVFIKAIAIEPENTPYYDKLVKSLEYQGRYDEAIEVLQKQIRLLKQHGDNSSATRLQKDIELLQFKKSKQEK